MMNKSPFRLYIGGMVLLLAILIISVGIGTVFIPPLTQLRVILAEVGLTTTNPTWPTTFRTILVQIRLPHTVLVALTGAALASSGAAYQGLFRNPLADPYLIGVASGAGLGAVLAMTLGLPTGWLGLYAIPVAAFIGAFATIITVYLLARTGGSVPVATLILAGVAVSSFTVSLTSYLMFRSTGELRRALSWLLGGGLLPGWDPVLAILPYMIVGMLGLVAFGYSLNVLQFGDEQAHQLGLPVEKRKLYIILAATVTTAAAVSFSGIIGFVGLIVPHIIRFIWGGDYRRLIPLSIIGGSIMLLLADLVARVAMAPQVLPVGIVTALVGAPFFLWILKRAKLQGNW